MSDVCKKYFAGAVDMLADLSEVPQFGFHPEKCLEAMALS